MEEMANTVGEESEGGTNGVCAAEVETDLAVIGHYFAEMKVPEFMMLCCQE